MVHQDPSREGDKPACQPCLSCCRLHVPILELVWYIKHHDEDKPCTCSHCLVSHNRHFTSSLMICQQHCSCMLCCLHQDDCSCQRLPYRCLLLTLILCLCRLATEATSGFLTCLAASRTLHSRLQWHDQAGRPNKLQHHLYNSTQYHSQGCALLP